MNRQDLSTGCNYKFDLAILLQSIAQLRVA